ncbi:FMN-dependent NADH-azoreductase [Methylocapsa palsarum]|uniref:FMN dependent NADH:quinone oxidoreductase n=1 Tax=Methylocapsa palsarum TaxID=1612308 RepID=A0A1I3X3T5_9HYPH|nr:NAD(P)H-dependent oxidoreductase [Methylocapsa palsarum]SFK14368.1 FMN-dependent NADH-azoreductase [Methylocapsa palsarum]
MKLLHVDSSILGPYSVSRKLTSDIVARLRELTPGLDVSYRDLAAEPLSHLSADHVAARQTGAPSASPRIQEELALGVDVLEQFLGADIVVLGAPMYNFGISSQLKAWIDRLAVAEKTFRYTENGPEGLAGGKRVIVVSTRGGVFSEGAPAAALDHQETYLRSVFGFLGIPDVEIVRAEGLNYGPESKAEAIRAAVDKIANLKAA